MTPSYLKMADGWAWMFLLSLVLFILPAIIYRIKADENEKKRKSMELGDPRVRRPLRTDGLAGH